MREQSLRALVVYESSFGHTEIVAEEIARGLREFMDVDLQDVFEPGGFEPQAYDVVVVGGPTHSYTTSNQRARVDVWWHDRAGLMRTGIREWARARTVRPDPLLIAAFDTRDRSRRLGRSTAASLSRSLGRRSRRVPVACPMSFYVHEATGPLEPGEARRARAWGVSLAVLVGATHRADSRQA